MANRVAGNGNELLWKNIDLVRRVMEDMLLLLFLDEPARRRIGLTQISRLIGYTPGWYLWTEERKGAYLLELMSARTLKQKSVLAYFLIRYYPSPEEADFPDFAPVEQKVRLGPSFDRTGTPKFEKKGEIHESLFAVGNMHILVDKRLNFIKLKLFSQDRWLEIIPNEEDEPSATDRAAKVVSPLAVSRNVPGWKLSWVLFDKLLLGFCYVHKSSPLGSRLTVSPGFKYHVGSNGNVFEVPDSTIQRWTLETAILRKLAPKSNQKLKTWKEKFSAYRCRPLKKGEKLIADFVDPPEKEYPWIDSNWWAAASWTFSQQWDTNHRCLQAH